MNIAKRILWISVGVGLGIALSAAPSIRAQQANDPNSNVVVVHFVQDGYGLFFMSDDKTQACWVGFQGNGEITTLSPAPKEACVGRRTRREDK
jgi:hypothetical protein